MSSAITSLRAVQLVARGHVLAPTQEDLDLVVDLLEEGAQRVDGGDAAYPLMFEAQRARERFELLRAAIEADVHKLWFLDAAGVVHGCGADD